METLLVTRDKDDPLDLSASTYGFDDGRVETGARGVAVGVRNF